MTQIKPLSSMETPRFADVATFFRLPVEKAVSYTHLTLPTTMRV